ncbi:GerAB/ArcD/ProY family transporter [Cohnella lubricantis]|uniref:GerAB/ArcD/ProY family transporter n=1 Tax=Cohnella lubricantis TaxID=2163172 RepID=A0A841TF86_9BACL|nr:GerAB/ArcD/ProY family transporter [Cohnella lubricantis]MBB6678629.1 GerAB/ArcD/ProY family transporter [Cohnella lubricantis]MBP2119211.1 spore germination protein KB [Cohnella lubricantis]
MQKIVQYELAAGIFLVQVGSSPLFLLAKPAGRDAWMSVLLALLAGLLLLAAVTLPIYRREPDSSLAELLLAYLGKWLGGAVTAAYMVYFAYQSVRNVREFGDWMLMYLLPTTPLGFVALVMMAVSAFAVYKGPEVFFRVALLIAPGVTLMYGLLYGPIFFSDLFRPEELQPALEHGLRPVVMAALPTVVSFPFGEMVLFLMFLKYGGRSSLTSRTTLLTFLFAGLLIVAANVLLIGVLGPLADTSVIPLLQSAGLFKMVERLDPIVLLLLFVGVFMKQTAYYLAAVLCMAQLTGAKAHYFIVPVGALIYLGALGFRSYMQQVSVGFKYNLVYHFPIFEVAVPIVLLAVMLLRSPKASAMGE